MVGEETLVTRKKKKSQASSGKEKGGDEDEEEEDLDLSGEDSDGDSSPSTPSLSNQLPNSRKYVGCKRTNFVDVTYMYTVVHVYMYIICMYRVKTC